jgi:hypothetical protein
MPRTRRSKRPPRGLTLPQIAVISLFGVVLVLLVVTLLVRPII